MPNSAPSRSSSDGAATVALKTLDDVRERLLARRRPIHYLSRTPTHLAGMQSVVPALRFLCVADAWDGREPALTTPSTHPPGELRGNVMLVNWLLQQPEVVRSIRDAAIPAEPAHILVAFKDEKTEDLCASLGFELILPPERLRRRVDSKLEATRLAESIGVPNVPNAILTISTWDRLRDDARRHGLGDDLVVQAEFGDGGRTTFFVDDAASFAAMATTSAGREMKVMARIEHRSFAVDAVITRCGVIVGPCLREVTGHPELTPERGGWAGNESADASLTDAQRAEVVDLVRRLGERIAADGYRGVFEVDLLVETVTGQIYLGEINPRLSGASIVSNAVTEAATGVPLLAFHLLEFSDDALELDVESINARYRDAGRDEVFGSLLLQYRGPERELVTAAPPSGRYRLTQGQLESVATSTESSGLGSPDELILLRVNGVGEIRSAGADLGMVLLRSKMQDAAGALTPIAREVIDAVHAAYWAVPADTPAIAGHNSVATVGG